MPPSELKTIVEEAIKHNREYDWLILVFSVIIALISTFIFQYLKDKGKNLATKEDISEITEKVEGVKVGYAKVLEEVKSNNQLKLANIEREKLLKKEVYLEAAEAIVRYQNVISILPEISISNEQLSSSFADYSGRIAKIHMVATEETLKAVTVFVGEVNSAFMNLMLDRGNLMVRKLKIDNLETYRAKYNNEVERCLTIMRNMNLEGNSNKKAWNRVNQSFETECERRNEVADEINQLWETQKREHFSFTRKCMDSYFEITKLTPNIIIAVRRELELDIDKEKYLEILRENQEKVESIFNNFMSDLEKKKTNNSLG